MCLYCIDQEDRHHMIEGDGFVSYSSLYYDMETNLSDDGRFLIVPQDTVAEILVPANDISGAIK